MNPQERLGDDITALLAAWTQGDTAAEAELIETVYPALHELVGHHVARESAELGLQVTEVLHETYLKLRRSRETEWHDRVHFFAVASRVVRQILVDGARRRDADKRGGSFKAVDLETFSLASDPAVDIDLIALHRALERLETLDRESARIVELRFFGGLSIEETARVLGLGRTSVVVGWRHARAWLRSELDALEA